MLFGTTYNVSGVVQLEDQISNSDNHDGVKVRFLDLSNNLTPEDSTTTSETGSYSINISPGYYLVEWTKTGYVPMEPRRIGPCRKYCIRYSNYDSRRNIKFLEIF